MIYARVVVLSPVQAPSGQALHFDYHLPAEWAAGVSVGSLVTAPFGPRTLYGIVVDLPAEPEVEETRPVSSLVDPQPVLSAVHIELARWMSRETLTPLHECLLLMLPPGVVGLTDSRLEVVAPAPTDRPLGSLERRLLELLGRRGPLLGRQLDCAFQRSDWRPAAERLVRRGVLARVSVLAAPRAAPKQVTAVALRPHIDATAALHGLRSPLYSAVVDFLRQEGGPVDISGLYAQTGCSREHLNRLAERGLVTLVTEDVWRDPLAGQVFVPTVPLPLTSDQQAAWDVLRPALGRAEFAPFLLYGVTGSGKTELYLQAVAEVLAQQRKAIVLVPEISLTPQTVTRFAGRFPGRVTIVHSQLSEGERYDVWRQIRAGRIDVVVGPRSALFAPLASLGLIVLDEEHDASFKQVSRPTYHAREAALQLARLSGAAVLMGSATPSLESYRRAQRGEFCLLTLQRRILGHTRRLSDLQSVYHVRHNRYRDLWDGSPEVRYMPLPPVLVVDMRAELKAGNRSILSRPLVRVLDEALERGEQAILFLNRRGTATFVLCRDCGTVLRCPACDVPLTYHGVQRELLCHLCGRRVPQPQLCPHCGSTRIRYFGLGTAGVEDALRERWPAARLLRWDRDTARTAEAHWNILDRFSNGQADVLVGTQMIAKGLDLPLVTVVGVISADTALDLPDLYAAERTFQLLEQVSGRAGRGLLGGRVVLQTYHPDHYAVVAAARHDYERLAREELAFRRAQSYPPFVRLARLLYRHVDPQRAQVAAQNLAGRLRAALAGEGLPSSDLIGPAPAFYARLRGKYCWQIVVRHVDPPAFLRRVDIPSGWLVDVDPVSLL